VWRLQGTRSGPYTTLGEKRVRTSIVEVGEKSTRKLAHSSSPLLILHNTREIKGSIKNYMVFRGDGQSSWPFVSISSGNRSLGVRWSHLGPNIIRSWAYLLTLEREVRGLGTANTRRVMDGPPWKPIEYFLENPNIRTCVEPQGAKQKTRMSRLP